MVNSLINASITILKIIAELVNQIKAGFRYQEKLNGAANRGKRR